MLLAPLGVEMQTATGHSRPSRARGGKRSQARLGRSWKTGTRSRSLLARVLSEVEPTSRQPRQNGRCSRPHSLATAISFSRADYPGIVIQTSHWSPNRRAVISDSEHAADCSELCVRRPSALLVPCPELRHSPRNCAPQVGTGGIVRLVSADWWSKSGFGSDSGSIVLNLLRHGIFEESPEASNVGQPRVLSRRIGRNGHREGDWLNCAKPLSSTGDIGRPR